MRIEGHTDSRDVSTARIQDNWELSAARALTLFRYFTVRAGIDPARFTVVGYGEQRPIATNLTAAGRARNRRVTITLVGRLRRIGEP